MNAKRLTLAGTAFLAVTGATVASAAQPQEAGAADLWVQSNGGQGRFSVEYVADGRTVGLQFDIKGSFDDQSVKCGEKLPASHIASCTVRDDGSLRVVVFSTSNAVLPDATLVTYRADVNSVARGRKREIDTLDANSAGPVSIAGQVLQNVEMADVNAELTTPAHLKD